MSINSPTHPPVLASGRILSCHVVATSNLSLQGTQTVDGVAVQAGNIVLATAQTFPSQNGPWVVAVGGWSRPTDYANGTVTNGRSVIVDVITPSVQGGALWRLVNPSAPITVDVTPTAWASIGLAQNDRRYGIQRRPVASGLSAWHESTAQTSAGTCRVPVWIAAACTDLTFTWQNFFSSTLTDTDNGTVVPINASVEIGATIYRLTFGGQITGTMQGGGSITCDPLAVDIAAGTQVYVRTFVNATNWYGNHRAFYAGAGGFTTTTDLTAPGSTTIADQTTGQRLLGPVSANGHPVVSTPSVLIAGDSIASGQSDGGLTFALTGKNTAFAALGGGGFIARALTAAGIGSVNAALPSDTIQNFVGISGHFRRLTLAATCTSAICEYGRNDLTGGRTLAQVQADLITAWGMFVNRGLRTFQTTITPLSTSTDNFITVVNQTVGNAGAETSRVAFNTWLRDGAPMIGTAPQAVGATGSTVARCNVYGTTGALVTAASGAAHMLYGIFDVADAAESSRNSGLWKASLLNRTVVDAVTTLNGFNCTAADWGAVGSNDNGRTIIIGGAGTSGATFAATVAGVNSGTSIGLATSTPTAVNPATASLYDAYTLDGTHPQPYGSVAVAGAINTAALI